MIYSRKIFGNKVFNEGDSSRLYISRFMNGCLCDMKEILNDIDKWMDNKKFVKKGVVGLAG